MNKTKINTLIASAMAIGLLVSNGVNADEIENKDTVVIESRAINATGKGQVINVKSGSSLNIRKTASTSASVIGKIPANQKFDIVEKSGSWYKIKYDGATGYVHGDYVKVLSLSESNTAVSSNGYGQVINATSGIEIRKTASKSASSLGKMPYGAGFDILGTSGDWYKVKYYDVIGYVYYENVRVLKGNIVIQKPSQDVNDVAYGKVVNIANTAKANIYKSKNTTSDIIDKMSFGAGCDVLEKSGDWYKIKYYSSVGYIQSKYIEILKSSSTVKPESSNGYGQVINTASLNIRKSASDSSNVIGTMPNGAGFDILGTSGDWYKVKYYDVIGYVHYKYVKVLKGNIVITPPGNSGSGNVTKKEYGQVINVSSGSRLRVRSKANTSSDIVGYVGPSEKVEILGKESGWYKIVFNGGTGYVHGDYIKIINEGTSTGPSGGSSQTEEAKKTFDKIMKVIEPQIGSPYVYGGAGEIITQELLDKLKVLYPSYDEKGAYDLDVKYLDKHYRAFDCSGLLQWAFKQVGINIGRNTKAQINEGVEVSIDELQPGDFIFYKTLGHVGMYVGDGKWVESPKPGTFVRVTDVPWSQVERVRRILK